MHTALWQLLWFDIRGTLRSLANIRKNWRQLALMLLILAFVGLMLWARTFSDVDASGRFGAGMPFWALVYLSATWLTASADRGLVMRPAEIHFVVGGPFAAHDVITLTLVRLVLRALFSSCVLALIAMTYVQNYAATLLGIWLLVTVSLLVGMLASLMSRSAQRATVKWMRRGFSALVMGALIGIVAQAISRVQAAGEKPHISAIAAAAPLTPIGQIVLPPVQWMFYPLSARTFYPDALQAVPARLGVLGVLVAAIYAFSGRFSEGVTGRTDLSMRRRQAARRSGGAAGSGLTRHIRVPQFGKSGLAAVAWMQMTHSVRILPRYLLFTSTVVGLVLVVPIMASDNFLRGQAAIGWLAGLTLYADFLLLLQLPVGFLGPVSQRELLKSLPIRSWQIALGQLAGPVIPLAVLHLLVALLFLYLVPAERRLLSVTAIALVPGALVIIANINLLGAWGIVRPKALQQRDALAAGRAVASVWIFFATLMPAVMIAAVCGGLAAMLSGGDTIATIAAAAVGAALSSTIYIALLARAVDRWQPGGGRRGSEEAEHNQ